LGYSVQLSRAACKGLQVRGGGKRPSYVCLDRLKHCLNV